MKNGRINPVIVVVAYNRENCMRRLLSALANAVYGDEVTLIISIDYGDNQNVVDLAENFVWNHGRKIVRTFTENLGCRDHVMKCIDYSMEFGAAIIFEDDMLPSLNFYTYVQKSLQAYADDENIFAVALHNQLWNGFADALFLPVRNDFDAYIAQIECSRGECFIGDRWKAFREWYEENRNGLKVNEHVPRAVYDWNDSWCKYVLNYIVEKNLYYVTPYDSLTTCFTDAGTHLKGGETKYKYQVPVAKGKGTYLFPAFEEAVKYDAFFESMDLKRQIEEQYGKRALVDYYGTKDNYGDAQLCLTRKALPYKVLETYGDEMLQPELNYLYRIQGDEIALYDLEEPAEERKTAERKDSIYFGAELEAARETADRNFAIMNLFSQWMKAIRQGKGIADYLERHGIKKVAIYGLGMLGERLYDELYDSDITVVCGIDRNLGIRYRNLPVRSISQIPDEVTDIIVTAVYFYQDIKKELAYHTDAKVMSLQDVVEELAEGGD